MKKTIVSLESEKPKEHNNKMLYSAFLVAAGSGGGKTRLLREIFRYYVNNESNESTVIFITFNGEGIVSQPKNLDQAYFTGFF